MKYLFLFGVVVSMFFSTPLLSHAQDKEFGGGLTVISDYGYSMVGFNARYYHYLNEEFRLVPSVDLAFGDANAFVIGGGVNFLPEFVDFDDFRFYVAAKLDYTYLWASGVSDSGIGVDFDFLGFEYQLDNMKIFGESGLRFGGPTGYDPWITRIGVTFTLD